MSDASTLAQLLGPLADEVLKPFLAGPYYNPDLDWLIWLDEDVGYRASPVHPWLDMLLAPHENRVVGFKVIGAKAMFESLGYTVVEGGRTK